MIKVCEVCGNEYEGRADSRTCNDACKKALQRAKGDKLEAKGDNKGDIIKGDKQLKGTKEKPGKCSSEIGDKFCSCGQRIWPVLHPIGPHEVIYTRRTMHLRSSYTDYIPEIVRQGRTNPCSCDYCTTRTMKKQEVRA